MRDRFSIPLAIAGVAVMIWGISLLGLFLRYPMTLFNFLGSLVSMLVAVTGMGMMMPLVVEGERR